MEKSEIIQRFVMARRFAKVAAELMGVDGVRIYHDQALFKEPSGGTRHGIKIKFIGRLIQTKRSQCGCQSFQLQKRWDL